MSRASWACARRRDYCLLVVDAIPTQSGALFCRAAHPSQMECESTFCPSIHRAQRAVLPAICRRAAPVRTRHTSRGVRRRRRPPRFERRRLGLPSSSPASSLGASRRTQAKEEPGCEGGDGQACTHAEDDQVARHDTSTSNSSGSKLARRPESRSARYLLLPASLGVDLLRMPLFVARAHCADR